jgi:hypothetical protein
VDRYSFDAGRSHVPSSGRFIPALPSPLAIPVESLDAITIALAAKEIAAGPPGLPGITGADFT